MKRILFIDDEPQLLSGLENALRKQRKQWEMKFVSSGDVALTELQRAEYDVVVCDMRMPGMDGPSLLGKVKETYPRTARIVLSGQADQQAIIRAVPVAQQFLSKPCDPEKLRGTIERVCALQALVHDAAAQSIIGGIDSLPPSPKIYLELTGALNRQDVGIAELAGIVENDPALSLKVLQLANSAFFGGGQKTVSVRSAVMYLGVELLRVLVLVASVFMRTEKESRARRQLCEDLQHHSMLLARIAPKFISDRKRAEQAVAGALLHDVGMLVFANDGKPGAEVVLEAARRTGKPVVEVERELGAPSHALAGALLLGTWGLPFELVEIAAYHHAPSEASEHSPIDVLCAVHGAEELVDAIQHKRSEPHLDLACLERAGVLAKVGDWQRIAEEVVNQQTAAGSSAV
jgi:HD-like signal output (HDOD) protein